MKWLPLFVLLVLCVAMVSCGGGTPATITVEINGDSICSGTGTKTTCAQLLPADWVVDDRAVAGLTLHSLYTGYAEVWAGGPLGPRGVQQRFAQTDHPSQFVVISMGANDAYESRDPSAFEAELRAILLHIQSLGKTPVVTGIVHFSPGPVFDAGTVERAQALNAITHRVAAEMGVLDAHWDTVNSTDTVDGIHRTEPTLRILVARLVETIKTLRTGL